MGIHPENCIVVADAQAGIAASRAAGMLSVGMGPARVEWELRIWFFPTGALLSEDEKD
jgi:beta-phosphoglucomutase-like phosphatase (HAD superfamily)